MSLLNSNNPSATPTPELGATEFTGTLRNIGLRGAEGMPALAAEAQLIELAGDLVRKAASNDDQNA